MDETAPTASILYNYDTDRDSFAGLLIAKGGEYESRDPTTAQVWEVTFGVDTDLSGTATPPLWSASKDLDTSKGGTASARLYDCTGTGTACSTIDTASVLATPWSPTGTWTERIIDFGPISHTITACRCLTASTRRSRIRDRRRPRRVRTGARLIDTGSRVSDSPPALRPRLR